ncbi:metal-dependent transcriptional regulator [Lacrimispora saccharolytica]|uniref:Iron (Metal) dependent repressor, DtxR family n=1 Tax=Lacrimispora saccharolytica (strain ATCC 35040 / DSM 2544 / NRCC 2533 / WM1) TaxID=610130 RepID=D9R1V8_LACSW|nr:metal-dependent transcriptional regulator [Lacrimispora saccharolytica]ADL02849.1 iron (metal) dependent repressor, DtxR family [[Clostridium] saccharolyticum WM1]QRV18948.1 metal-dependent transcriptional regulator [Lacrimispora saccharolytica]
MNQNMCYHSGKKLSTSKEEYLKAIYKLSKKTQAVRSIDLAVYLGVSKPSVNNAVTILQEEGFVVKPLRGEIHLTDEGYKQGQIITAKFQIIKQLLITCCNVNERTASKDACKMEHLISDETAIALKKYMIKCKEMFLEQ